VALGAVVAVLLDKRASRTARRVIQPILLQPAPVLVAVEARRITARAAQAAAVE